MLLMIVVAPRVIAHPARVAKDVSDRDRHQHQPEHDPQRDAVPDSDPRRLRGHTGRERVHRRGEHAGTRAEEDQRSRHHAVVAQREHDGHKESIADTGRVLGRMFDAIEYRGSAHSAVEEFAAHAGVPVYNGLTDDWHPTQMLADFLTMGEASRKPYGELSYCYLGDAQNNTGRSLLAMGAIMGADVRICGARELWPPDDVQQIAAQRAEQSGAQITLTEDLDEGLPGADFVYTDVWVSMGEAKGVWHERVELLAPYQVNRTAMDKTGNPRAKFLHCLPAFHDSSTKVGAEIMQETGMEGGLEVTNEVFESPHSIVFDQAENRLHTIKAVLVATLAAS